MRGYRNYASDPHPGVLNAQIDIVQVINAVNDNGYPDAQRTTIYSKLWSAPDDAGNQTFRAGDQEVMQSVVNFVIRYRPGITVGMYVLFGEQLREIVDIGNYGFRRRYLGLKTHFNWAMGQ